MLSLLSFICYSKGKYEAKKGEMICYWFKAVFRNDKLEAFQKHLTECKKE
jgi:hypothetical protein